jgi:shikimate dehydrogenase
MILSGKAKLAGLLGWPVGHTRSPRLHGYWLDHYGIDGVYVPLPVAPERFEQVVRALPHMGFAGVNVTVPHKLAALALSDRPDRLAERIGAVNTMVFRQDGSIEGYNTDAFGFIESLRGGVPGFSAARGPTVMLGAGGAARAVAVALEDDGMPELRIVNRTAARAELLARDLKVPVRVYSWEACGEALAGATLLVNTTTLGMDGEPPLPIGLEGLPKDAVVTDIVYAPLETDLLANARRRGNRVVDGLGMLLHQGRPGFAAWFGVMPEVTEELRDFVADR